MTRSPNRTPPTLGDSPLEFRYSVRLWMPLLLGAVVVLGLGTILIATHREVESTLLGVATERAEEAASRIADLIHQGTVGGRESVRSDPTLRDFLADPTPDHRAAVEAASAPSAPFGRIEVWDASGTLVLEMATPDADPTRLPRFLPVGDPPLEEAVSVLRESAGRFFVDVVTEVRAGPTADGARLGWVREYGTLSLTGLELRQLLGTGGDMRIGSLDGGVWANLTSVTSPPLRRTDAGEVEQFLDEEWVDATFAVEGTPLLVWAGFPRDLVVAPATSFTRRTSLLSLLFLAGAVLVPLLIATYLTEPLHSLTRAAGRIAAGDYSRRVRVHRRDEIGKLSDAFNTMAGEVEDAYATLRRRHDETHFALSVARIGIWEADLRTELVACSPSLANVFGIGETALPKTRGELLALLHPDDRDRLRPHLEGDASESDTFDIDCRSVDERGVVHWIEGKGQVRRDPDGAPPTVFGVFMDVTERRQLEERLRHSQKMEAIGQLAGGVAHDFNNLLTSIVSHGSLLSEQLPDNTPEHEDVMAILQAGESAAALTRQLLTFSRRQVIHPQLVDLNEVIANTQKLLSRLIPEHIDVVCLPAPGLPSIMIDPGELEQVIMNLAINARDAMPDGGVLRLSTASRDTDARLDGGGSPARDREVVLTVEDNGAGMDPETIDRIFEPFFTTKPVGEGTGLGLATVYGIVKKAGGSMEVSSQLARGSTFQVCFPVPEDVAPRSVGEPPTSAPAHYGTETILVVEDDASVRGVAQKILSRAGYEVLVAASGEEALSLLEASGVRPDLVVSDVVMPGMRGTELWQKLRERYPGLRVMLTSGYSHEDVRPADLSEIDIAFLEKPYTSAVLKEKIRSVLGAGTTA